MGVCPNCGSWVDDGDICMNCGGSGSYSYGHEAAYTEDLVLYFRVAAVTVTAMRTIRMKLILIRLILKEMNIQIKHGITIWSFKMKTLFITLI